MKLAIIGASYLQLPLIKKAREMGVETHVFAWEEGAVGKNFSDYFYPISIIDKEKILSVCKDIGIDGITTIASDLAVVTVNYIANKLGLVGNSPFSTEVMTDKFKMRREFKKNHLPSPKFVLIKDTNNLDEKVIGFKYPLIVKPVDRSGSRGITKVEDITQLYQAVERAIDYSLSKNAIVEEFVNGNEISVETISYNGDHYHLAITDKITTGSPYFVELEHHQPSIFVDTLKNEIINLVNKALNALEFKNGASHSELLISDDNTITIVEIGGRMGGDFIGSDLVRLSTGYDFLKGVIDIALGHFIIPQNVSYKKYSGVKYYKNEPGIVKDIFKNDRFNFKILIEEELQISVGDRISPIRESADRIGYFLYQSNTRYDREEFPYNIKIEKDK